MITFLRHLVAAPLRLLAWICGFFRVIDRRVLAEAIWFVTRDAEDGALVVALTAESKDLAAARQRAERTLGQCRHAQVALVIGLMEVQQGDYAAAAGWLERARGMDCEKAELLLLLELYCSAMLPGYDLDDTVKRILTRNDLPMHYTSIALGVRTDMLLDQQRWDEAEAIADRILALEEKPYARMTKWTTSLRRGDQPQAERHLSFARRALAEPVFHYNVASGLLLLGCRSEAMEELHKAVQAGFKPHATKTAINQLLASPEFAAYCRQREDQTCP